MLLRNIPRYIQVKKITNFDTFKRILSTISDEELSLFQPNFVKISNLRKHRKLSMEKHELILTILNSTATKREARNYLTKYRILDDNDIYKNKHKLINLDDNESQMVTNEGYSSYIDNILSDNASNNNHEIGLEHSPNNISSDNASNDIKSTQTIRVCALRIKNLDQWSDDQMQNLAVVLRKAMSLGASPLIIIDGDLLNSCNSTIEKEKELYIESKLEQLLENFGEVLPSRIVQGCFDMDAEGKLTTVIPEMIGVPLMSGIIPIISPIVVKSKSLERTCIQGFELTNEIVKCLEEKDFKGLLSVEKVVFIGHTGGFPSIERSKGSHVLVNLLQEYDDITEEITTKLKLTDEQRSIHLSNLNEMNQLLERSPNITGMLTTVEMSTREEEKQVGKETNPIIFNILTDRPTISSSLPVSLRRTPQLNTTIVKKGMSITTFFDKDPKKGLDLIEMDKLGKIDLKKLKFLMDDSFGRDLNMNHYLNRINKRVAGLIISGDYEGGAIITWEDSKHGSVAYLDKFAVIKKKQGIPGIADIVFKAMLNNFKNELLWRSRKNNPVNKWYFERSKANVSIPGTQWRLFVTGEQELTLEKLNEYSKICGSIEPSFDIDESVKS